MNPSKQGTDKNQWSEWSSTSSASNRGEEFAEQQRYHAQHWLTVAAMPSHHDSFPRLADHTYRDFSTYIKDGNRIEKHKKSDRNFPARLHAMLSSEQYSHIISWMPHGRAWKVINKELLVEEAIPKFFGQSKFSSFTRQLSGWGFKRLHQTGQGKFNSMRVYSNSFLVALKLISFHLSIFILYRLWMLLPRVFPPWTSAAHGPHEKGT